MNIQLAIQHGTNILINKRINTAKLDAEILMAKALKKDRKYIILNNKEDLDGKDLKYFNKLIKERASYKPIAQIINKKFFWNNEFFVNENTLIPRPDTEAIVEQVLKLTKHKNMMNILDIGVGSGCILLSILKERKNFYGTGIDISKNALDICKINAKRLKVYGRAKLYKSDIDKFVEANYDLIISNPPYIKSCELKYLESDVVKFEPKLALDGGVDGLSEIRKVIKKSSELIKKNGKFVLEIGFNQKNKVVKLLKEKGFYINCTLKDLALNDRCIVSTKI
ncbi:peptide chain release factor N(5)-glutamine methyltransferase [Pelagibacterales bacterium SAG-MED25]|uniref:peptide chain release factor N(5)-glutamine methyltransferase n=1 Tax=Pelagibacter sp. (strain HTCC7211) TaxID=439493 RepID=UPI0003073DD5|nr:peptide chain release factor N(5)-glutamine methyltransferase [Candidatus Pelagibacter sp. HTCC7211]MBD1151409.1 peptide chain release factor N(5)-glutamine methyltransferase [Pelagibacterales bacterium SAG-MED25]